MIFITLVVVVVCWECKKIQNKDFICLYQIQLVSVGSVGLPTKFPDDVVLNGCQTTDRPSSDGVDSMVGGWMEGM